MRPTHWMFPGWCSGLIKGVFAGLAIAQTPIEQERIAWHYTNKVEGNEVIVTLIRGSEEPAIWYAKRSDDQQQSFQETARVADFVEIQNRETRLFIRLYNDHAEWRQPKQESWKRWVNGAWVTPTREELAAILPVQPISLKEQKDTSSNIQNLEDAKADQQAMADHRRAFDEEAMQNSPATQLLTASQKADYRLRLIYFVPNDRQPIADFEARIHVVMSIVDDIYRRALSEHRLRFDGFEYPMADGKAVVQLIRGQKPAAFYNNAPKYDGDEQYRRLRSEIVANVGSPSRNLILVFAETWDEGSSPVLWPGMLARGAYYGPDGGLAIVSSHLLAPGFCATTPQALKLLMQNSEPVVGRRAFGHAINSPRGEFVEDAIGSVAHELGHTLGLPHDMRNESAYIMGNGFRNLLNNYRKGREPIGFSPEIATMLAVSRYISMAARNQDPIPPVAKLSLVKKSGPTQLIRIETEDDKALHAVIFFELSEGTIIGGTRLQGKKQTIQQSFAINNRKGDPLQLQAIVIDTGGNQVRVKQ